MMVRFVIEFVLTQPLGSGFVAVEAHNDVEAEYKAQDVVKAHFSSANTLITNLHVECADSEALDEEEYDLIPLNQVFDYEEYQEPNL